MKIYRPHPFNALGDDFVEDQCCLTCNIPFIIAPDLFAWAHDDEGRPIHCYVKRQPRTADEQNLMCEVIRHVEADCIMYCGTERAVQARLVSAGLGGV